MPEITHIIDASALIAYFKGEPGYERFAGFLADEENVLAIHIVNLCEVYYGYFRSDGQDKAEEVWSKAINFLRVLEKANDSFMKRVGRWKATQHISLADAFAAASAENDGVPLVTTDHLEFDPIEKSGLLQIEWLR
jgi:predicted nucleic acid-binding protein